MGILEKESRKRSRKKNIKKVLLATVATAGLLGVALVTPNALQALKIFGIKPGKRQKEIIERSRIHLIKIGLLEYTEKGFLKLTPKGEAKLRQLELSDFKLKKPKRWDKKWRVLIFDIKEERKSLRNKVRLTLKTIGFKRLQDSVWVYPYDCEDLVTLFKTDFKVGRDILYLIVDSIENDYPLKKHFNLS